MLTLMCVLPIQRQPTGLHPRLFAVAHYNHHKSANDMLGRTKSWRHVRRV